MSKRNFVSTPTMRALAAAVQANVPVLVWGNPGQAKSAKIESYSKKWNMHIETVVGSVRESSDYLGLPIEIDGQVVYSPPAWAIRLNAAKKSVLFLDELTTSAPSVQKAMLRIMQERYVGEYKLNDGVVIIAAANPPETAADGWELPAPVANRLLHMDWHFDVEEWLSGVGNNFETSTTYSIEQLIGKYDESNRARSYALITSFLRSRPEFLAPNPPEDPDKAGKAWPSPRSWTNAISALAHLDAGDEDAATLILKGCVGQDHAVEFIAWAADQDLPNPVDVLKDPSIVDWSMRPDKLFAVVTAVSYLAVARGDVVTWNAAVAVMEACGENERPDVALPSMRNLVAKMPKGAAISTSARAMFADLFEKAGILEAAEAA